MSSVLTRAACKRRRLLEKEADSAQSLTSADIPSPVGKVGNLVVNNEHSQVLTKKKRNTKAKSGDRKEFVKVKCEKKQLDIPRSAAKPSVLVPFLLKQKSPCVCTSHVIWRVQWPYDVRALVYDNVQCVFWMLIGMRDRGPVVRVDPWAISSNYDSLSTDTHAEIPGITYHYEELHELGYCDTALCFDSHRNKLVTGRGQELLVLDVETLKVESVITIDDSHYIQFVSFNPLDKCYYAQDNNGNFYHVHPGTKDVMMKFELSKRIEQDVFPWHSDAMIHSEPYTCFLSGLSGRFALSDWAKSGDNMSTHEPSEENISPFNIARGLAFDQKGRFYSCDIHNHRVLRFDPSEPERENAWEVMIDEEHFNAQHPFNLALAEDKGKQYVLLFANKPPTIIFLQTQDCT